MSFEKFSSLKFLKLLYQIWELSSSVGVPNRLAKTMNWGRWSDIEVVMLPQIQLSALLLMRILSMRVAVFSAILVGKVIRGIKLCHKRFSRNLVTPGDFACLSRLRLKWPVRIQILFSCVITPKHLFHIFIIKLKVLHRRVLVDSTQYAALFIRDFEFNEFRFQFFWEHLLIIHLEFVQCYNLVTQC